MVSPSPGEVVFFSLEYLTAASARIYPERRRRLFLFMLTGGGDMENSVRLFQFLDTTPRRIFRDWVVELWVVRSPELMG